MDNVIATLCSCGSGLPGDLCCALDRTTVTVVRVVSDEDLAALQAAAETFNKKSPEEGIEACLQILRQRPGVVPALHLLADMRKRQGIFTAELALRGRIVTMLPEDMPQLIRFVTALVEQGDKDEALSFARRAVWLAPDDVRAHWLIALAFAQVDRIADAEYHFDIAMARSERQGADLVLSFAEHLRVHGKIDKARELIDRVEARDGVTLRSLTDRAMLEAYAGNLDAAERNLEQVQKDWPNHPAHCLPRASIAEQRRDYAGALEIIDSYDAANLNVVTRLLRGRILGALGRIDESFAEFTAAKEKELKTARRVYNPEALEKRVARTRYRLTPKIMNGLPRAPTRKDVMRPLFISGYARSGTTMLEQSLSMHPRIAAGGELRATADVARRVPGLLGSPMVYPDALVELLTADRRHGLEMMRDDYLTNALPCVTPKSGATWFTDKALMSEPDAPLRHLMFPASPIINIVRHPLDVVLSVFSHQLPDTGGYSATLERAANLYKLTAEAAEQWRLTLPQIRYLRVRYEDILADQEGEMRRLFTFIGEQWDPACLSFQDNTRVAPTLSYSQVREKISDKGKYRYKKYLKHLAPVIPILEPVITMLGYTVEEA